MPFWFLNEHLATLPYLFLCNTKLWTILIFSEVENSYRYIDTTTWRGGVPLLQRINDLSLEAKFFRDEKLVVDIGLGKTAGCCCCLKSSSNGLTLLLLLLKLLEEKKRLENVGQGTSFLSSNFSNQKKIIITRTLWPALEDAEEEN